MSSKSNNIGKRGSKTGSKTTATTKKTNEKTPIITKEPEKDEKAEVKKGVSKKEIQDKEFEEEIQKKKLKEQLEEKKYRNIAVRIAPEENFICLSIDGSPSTKESLEIILTEFLPYIHDSVLICPHIYINSEDEKFNWRYQKSNVLDYYKTRLTTSLADYQGYLIIQDRDTSKAHEIEQVYKIAETNQCKYIFCGYEGLREQALKTKRIDVGIDYLMGESKIPVFIMKDNKKRGHKNKGYQWLLVMDKNISDSERVLDLFLPFIDRRVDKIYGFTLIPEYMTTDEDIKKKFYKKMEELNFKEKEQFDYSALPYKKSPSEVLVDFVNHNTEQFFDFVIFLNNPMKFKAQKEVCETFKYVKNIFANIGFCNYAYIHGYDYKELSKLPNEIDPRKYLDKIKKAKAKEVEDALKANEKKKEKMEDLEDAVENLINESKKKNADKEKETADVQKKMKNLDLDDKKKNLAKSQMPTKKKNEGGNIKKSYNPTMKKKTGKK